MSEKAFELVKSLKVLEGMTKEFVRQFKRPFEIIGIKPPAEDEAIRVSSSKYITESGILEAIASVYEELFTEEEISELIAQNNSPVGQKFLALTPTLVTRANNFRDEYFGPILTKMDVEFKSDEALKSAQKALVSDVMDQLDNILGGENPETDIPPEEWH